MSEHLNTLSDTALAELIEKAQALQAARKDPFRQLGTGQVKHINDGNSDRPNYAIIARGVESGFEGDTHIKVTRDGALYRYGRGPFKPMHQGFFEHGHDNLGQPGNARTIIRAVLLAFEKGVIG